MRTFFKATTAALTLTAVVAMTAPAVAGPVPSNLATVSATAPNTMIEVRSRRGAGIAAGIAAGVITGAIIAGAANSYYYGPGPYYYGGPGYYYGPGYYEPPPYYYAPRYYRYRAPVYVAPPPIYVEPPVVYAPRGGYYGPRGRCWVTTDDHRGFGYWRPC